MLRRLLLRELMLLSIFSPPDCVFCLGKFCFLGSFVEFIGFSPYPKNFFGNSWLFKNKTCKTHEKNERKCCHQCDCSIHGCSPFCFKFKILASNSLPLLKLSMYKITGNGVFIPLTELFIFYSLYCLGSL